MKFPWREIFKLAEWLDLLTKVAWGMLGACFTMLGYTIWGFKEQPALLPWAIGTGVCLIFLLGVSGLENKKEGSKNDN